jgi:hypothetical protein
MGNTQPKSAFEEVTEPLYDFAKNPEIKRVAEKNPESPEGLIEGASEMLDSIKSGNPLEIVGVATKYPMFMRFLEPFTNLIPGMGKKHRGFGKKRRSKKHRRSRKVSKKVSKKVSRKLRKASKKH